MNDRSRLAKNYVFADEGNVLFINPWFYTDGTDTYWPYTRVATPIQDLFTGTWECSEYEDETINLRRTIRFSGNSFTYSDVRTEGESVQLFQLEGPYEHDVENGFILVTISDHTEDGAPREDSRYVGHTLRWAYAPTERPDQITVLNFSDDQVWNETTRRWEDLGELESYYELYKRLDQTN